MEYEEVIAKMYKMLLAAAVFFCIVQLSWQFLKLASRNSVGV